MKTAKFFVPDIGDSLNVLLGHPQGRHLYRNVKKRIEKMMWAIGCQKIEPFTRPVFIRYQPQVKRGKSGRRLKRYDCINFAGTNKTIEDCLVQMGVLADDSPDHVYAVICEAPIDAPDGNEGVHVRICEVNEAHPFGIQDTLSFIHDGKNNKAQAAG